MGDTAGDPDAVQSIEEPVEKPSEENDVGDKVENTTETPDIAPETPEPIKPQVVSRMPILDRGHARGPPTTNDNPGQVVYVSNILGRTSRESVESVFKGFGGMTKFTFVVDPATHQCRGYAFVEFETVEVAEKCIAEMNGKLKIDGNVLCLEKAKRSGPRQTSMAARASYSRDDRQKGRYKPFDSSLEERPFVGIGRYGERELSPSDTRYYRILDDRRRVERPRYDDRYDDRDRDRGRDSMRDRPSQVAEPKSRITYPPNFRPPPQQSGSYY